MAIIPGIDLCIKNNNTSFVFTDTTGVYSPGNPGGYGEPNDSNTDITSAIIEVKFPSGDTKSLDVANIISSGIVVGDFVFPTGGKTNVEDGIYELTYTLTTPSGTVSTTISKLLLGNIRCCLSKMWLEVPNKMCNECETDSYVDRVLFAQGLYNSLCAMGGCYKLDLINKVLTKLQTLCDFEECNCK